jgi:sigma-B regulation protein RsbU (phosphoserine phosphatase)
VLTHINRVLARRAIEGRFVTMLYGVLGKDGRLSYSNAGHNPPILVTRRGVTRFEVGGPILGAFTRASFDEETVQLDPGDVLVVFSDGVTEAFNQDGAEFGEDQLLSVVTPHHNVGAGVLLERLFDAVRTFTLNTTQSDDITALVLRHTCSAV